MDESSFGAPGFAKLLLAPLISYACSTERRPTRMATERVCKQNGAVAGVSLHRTHGANALAAMNMEQEKNAILTRDGRRGSS